MGFSCHSNIFFGPQKCTFGLYFSYLFLELLNVFGFQSRSLILKSQNKSYRPAFFRKVSYKDSHFHMPYSNYPSYYLTIRLVLGYFIGGFRKFPTEGFPWSKSIKPCLQTRRYSGKGFYAVLLGDPFYSCPYWLGSFYLAGCCSWGNT